MSFNAWASRAMLGYLRCGSTSVQLFLYGSHACNCRYMRASSGVVSSTILLNLIYTCTLSVNDNAATAVTKDHDERPKKSFYQNNCISYQLEIYVLYSIQLFGVFYGFMISSIYFLPMSRQRYNTIISQ